MGYILNIDGACNKEKIFEHRKRGMDSILNLNTIWTAANFINYIEHSFSDTVADWYDSFNEYGKKYIRNDGNPSYYVQKSM